jgi:hypothetical protein
MPVRRFDGIVGEISEDGFDLDTSRGGELLRLCQTRPGAGSEAASVASIPPLEFRRTRFHP